MTSEQEGGRDEKGTRERGREGKRKGKGREGERERERERERWKQRGVREREREMETARGERRGGSDRDPKGHCPIEQLTTFDLFLHLSPPPCQAASGSEAAVEAEGALLVSLADTPNQRGAKQTLCFHFHNETPSLAAN